MHGRTTGTGRGLKWLLCLAAAVLLVYVVAHFAAEKPDENWLTPQLKQSLTESQIQTLNNFSPEERAEALENLKKDRALVTNDENWLTPQLKQSLTEGQLLRLNRFSPEERAEALENLRKNRALVTKEVEELFGPTELPVWMLYSGLEDHIETRKQMDPERRRHWILMNEGKLYAPWDVILIIGEERETEGMFDEIIRQSPRGFLLFFGRGTHTPLDEGYVKAISRMLERTEPLKRQKPLNPYAGVVFMTQLEEFQRGVIFSLNEDLVKRARNGLNPDQKGDSRETFYTLVNMLIDGSQMECQTNGDWFLKEAYIVGVKRLRQWKWDPSLERPEKLDSVDLIEFSDSILFTKERRDWAESR